MKLIIAIINDQDTDTVSETLTHENFRVTCIASTGSFLRSGRSTLLIGTEEMRVPRAFEILRESTTQPKDPKEHKATIFVVDVKEFLQV
ncbi:MAG: cyclic-di-AMP receptor [Anaerolineaceae bacterium]|nr:cyclic-di-AMP receptor [Anaerolineaceae bacterium]